MSANNEKFYTPDFYATHLGGSLESAQMIVPELFNLLHPQSVVDVGCGIGTWLSVFRDCGCPEIHGFDGPWVYESNMLIDRSEFSPVDVAKLPVPTRRFDLALCLEVAEHIDATCADQLVEFLIKSSDVVLFGAAIPHQGGANHINEQWPGYWMDKYQERGYLCQDVIRPMFWNNDKIAYWYSQNTYLYTRASVNLPIPHRVGAETTLIGAVHPRAWMEHHTDQGFVKLLASLPDAFWRAVKRRVRSTPPLR